MAARKIIAVTGATGAQGGGLARAILSDPAGTFAVRVLTRKVASERAEALSRQGAEIVFADADREATLERAFAGAFGVFCLTNFWEHFSPEREACQARAMARAARTAGVRHAIWSTLEDTRQYVPLDDERMPTLMGRYKVPHFDAKGEANQAFVDAGVPTTFLLTSFYWDNFITFGMEPRRGPGGALALTLPLGDAKLPGIATEDIGRCAYSIFKNGEAFLNRSVGIAGEHLTGLEMAARLGEALGEEVRYDAVSPEAYRALGFPGAAELGNMFQFKRDFQDVYCGARSVEFSRSLNPCLQTFERWLCANRHRIPLG